MDRYAKALIAALTGGLGALLTALADGHVTATEWVVTGLAAVAGLGAVWATPNAPATRPAEGGDRP
jgi:hypothetical protein